METTQIRDEKLWKIAKRRAEFKKHLLTYLVVNIFLWGIWFIGGVNHGYYGYMWPAWVSLGWGIGLFFNYMRAYTGFKDSMTEKEYQRLINKQNG